MQILESIRDEAAMNGWVEVDFQVHPPMLSFKKADCRMNIYYSTMTVGTALKHPKKGKTQLFRRNVQMNGLIKLFKNPRAHTGAGYY